MATPPKTDSFAWQAPAQVLADPVLWRCIVAFQSGFPRSLYDFFVAHDPSVVKSMDLQARRLVELLVKHGTAQQLEQLATVKYYSPRRWQETYTTVNLASLSRKAIEFNRVDMLEWAIAHDTEFDKIHTVWGIAIQYHQHGDYRVLDLLRVHKPIDPAKVSGYASRINDLDLARWFDEHLPYPVDKRHMEHAVSEGNLEMVKYLLDRYPEVNFGTWAFESASQRGHFDILRCLLQARPTHVDRDFVQRMIQKENKNEMQILADVGGFEDVAREVAASHVVDGDLERLARLLDSGLLPSGEPFSIDDAASYGKLDMVKFLVKRNLATATTRAMDAAAITRRWELVRYLHENRSEGCTTAVMDAAAAQGQLEELQFFHTNRSEGCTTRAMDKAAGVGVVDVVKFLHENRSEGCTARAMDKAAKHGRLHIVKYLHENRTEGCTTEAVDKAAAYGHMSVVQFLHAHRTEGCTADGIREAVKNGYVVVVRYLYEHYRSLFTADLLHELLLHGAFDIWTDLRELYPEQAHAVIESVLLEAGEKLELATIQFIIHELGRDDLAHLAVDGAAKNKLHKHAQWPRAVMAITGPGSCRLSAIRNAVASASPYNEPTELSFLISVCSESGASAVAIAEANEHSENYSLSRSLESWVANGSELQLPPVHPLLLDTRCPSWAVHLALANFEYVTDPYQRCARPVPWAVQAIYHGNRGLLEILRDLDNDDSVFSFEGARAAAIRSGSLALLQWLLTTIKLPVEPTLLDEALYYHQFEIAEWLVANCLDGCRTLNWDTKVNVSWIGPCDLVDGVLLQWIEDHAAVRDLVDFGGTVLRTTLSSVAT